MADGHNLVNAVNEVARWVGHGGGYNFLVEDIAQRVEYSLPRHTLVP